MHSLVVEAIGWFCPLIMFTDLLARLYQNQTLPTRVGCTKHPRTCAHIHTSHSLVHTAVHASAHAALVNSISVCDFNSVHSVQRRRSSIDDKPRLVLASLKYTRRARIAGEDAVYFRPKDALVFIPINSEGR